MIQESFLVHPLAPFRLDVTVWALRRRAQNRIDRWNGTIYTHVLLVDQVPVKVGVSQLQPASMPQLQVNVWSPEASEHLSSGVKEVLQRTLGFHIDLMGFYALAQNDQTVSPLAQRFLGLKPPRFPSLFDV